MSLGVGAIRNVSFSAQDRHTSRKSGLKDKETDINPISQKGEKMKLVTATFLGGLGLGVRLLAELVDDGFVGEKIVKKGMKIGEERTRNLKTPNAGTKKALISVASMLGIAGLFIGAVAIIYTMYNAPKINYNGKVSAFKKGKDMDVYIKGNKIETELYNQMNDKAKNADTADKDKLKMQYAQLRIVKNDLPEFLKDEKKLQNLSEKTSRYVNPFSADEKEKWRKLD